MKPTYHLPPNFSTPPPPEGPFLLGTIIRDFNRREQMRPLNQGEDNRVSIAESDIYTDHKGGFEETRSRLVGGELGIWAQFIGVDGIGAEASISAEKSGKDTYKFEKLETKYFYPSAKYIAESMALPDVDDYLKGSRFKKAVFLVTGIKVARGVSVSMEKATKFGGALGVGMNNPGGSNIQVGPRIAGQYEVGPGTAFSESSDIVVGIQCLKLRHKTSWLGGGGGGGELQSQVYTDGATFLGEGNDDQEQKMVLDNFVPVDPAGDNDLNTVECRGPSQDGETTELWVIPKEL